MNTGELRLITVGLSYNLSCIERTLSLGVGLDGRLSSPLKLGFFSKVPLLEDRPLSWENNTETLQYLSDQCHFLGKSEPVVSQPDNLWGYTGLIGCPLGETTTELTIVCLLLLF